jgi:hypothetical protein
MKFIAEMIDQCQTIGDVWLSDRGKSVIAIIRDSD